MKTKILVSALATTLIFAGCSRDKDVAPAASPEAALTGCPHVDIQPICDADYYALAASDGSTTVASHFFPGLTFTYGTAILKLTGNSSNPKVVVDVAAGGGLSVLNAKVYFGSAASIPLNPDGSVNTEAFPYSVPINPVCPTAGLILDVPTNGCIDWVIAVTLGELDMNGDIGIEHIVWAKGSPAGTNGFYVSFCPEPCREIQASPSCSDVLLIPGYTSSGCVTLTATSTVPGSPVVWSTGETTYSITVCPTTTTTYTVSATDPGFDIPSASVTVNVHSTTDCGVGGDKVIICHTPPGSGTGNNQCKPLSWVHNYLDANGGVDALKSGQYTLGPCGSQTYCE